MRGWAAGRWPNGATWIEFGKIDALRPVIPSLYKIVSIIQLPAVGAKPDAAGRFSPYINGIPESGQLISAMDATIS